MIAILRVDSREHIIIDISQLLSCSNFTSIVYYFVKKIPIKLVISLTKFLLIFYSLNSYHLEKISTFSLNYENFYFFFNSKFQ